MAKNTLAPPKANSLDAELPPVGNYGPPSYGRPDSLYDRLEQLSYGLGGGLAKQVEGYGQMVTHPLQSGQDILASLQAVAQNPRLASNAMYGMWNRATSGLEGLGEVAGENLNPRNLLKNLARPNVLEAVSGKFPNISNARIDAMIEALKDQYARKEISIDEFLSRTAPLNKMQFENTRKETIRNATGASRKTFESINQIPHGTKVDFTYGLNPEMQQGVVIGTHVLPNKYAGTARAPIVRLPDGRELRLSPHNVKQVYAPRAIEPE
jgi:hypothetical protein